jgi:hypothetical protein
MKHFILVAIVLCMSFMAKAQYTPANQPKVDNAAYRELRDKSTNAKIEAVILNVSGIVLCVTGTAMVVVGAFDEASKTDNGGSYDSNGNYTPNSKNNSTDDALIRNGIIVTGGGAILGIGSAVLYTRSGILYHRAREIKMSMNTNSVNIPVSGMQTNHLKQIGLGLSISL